MSDYKNILVALDLSNDADVVLQKAVTISSQFNAVLTVIHVVEPVVLDVNMEFAPSFNVDIETSLVERAEQFLKGTLERLSMKNCTSKVLVGSVKHEIHREAEENQIDLIIMGTHGRHGVARLLGSTANAVLHGAPCDILTVKIK